jgi:autotransporter family porin
LAYLRGCFEGRVTYLVEDGYTAGDLSGCLGWHFSGEWKDDNSLAYIGRVQRQLDERNWARL